MSPENYEDQIVPIKDAKAGDLVRTAKGELAIMRSRVVGGSYSLSIVDEKILRPEEIRYVQEEIRRAEEARIANFRRDLQKIWEELGDQMSDSSLSSRLRPLAVSLGGGQYQTDLADGRRITYRELTQSELIKWISSGTVPPDVLRLEMVVAPPRKSGDTEARKWVGVLSETPAPAVPQPRLENYNIQMDPRAVRWMLSRDPRPGESVTLEGQLLIYAGYSAEQDEMIFTFSGDPAVVEKVPIRRIRGERYIIQYSDFRESAGDSVGPALGAIYLDRRTQRYFRIEKIYNDGLDMLVTDMGPPLAPNKNGRVLPLFESWMVPGDVDSADVATPQSTYTLRLGIEGEDPEQERQRQRAEAEFDGEYQWRDVAQLREAAQWLWKNAPFAEVDNAVYLQRAAKIHNVTLVRLRCYLLQQGLRRICAGEASPERPVIPEGAPVRLYDFEESVENV